MENPCASTRHRHRWKIKITLKSKMLNSQKDTDKERRRRRGTEADNNLYKTYICISVSVCSEKSKRINLKFANERRISMLSVALQRELNKDAIECQVATHFPSCNTLESKSWNQYRPQLRQKVSTVFPFFLDERHFVLNYSLNTLQVSGPNGYIGSGNMLTRLIYTFSYFLKRIWLQDICQSISFVGGL